MPSILALIIGPVSVASGLPAVPDTSRAWHQGVRYELSATIDDPTGTVTGRGVIYYVNHSPDTLRSIFFHLHLNAFRPGSRWAARDAQEGRHRFDRLANLEYGYERVGRASINGTLVFPFFPYAPDSTVAGFGLPSPLLPGDTAEIRLVWQSRPSTVPRRQGRRGRRLDFAHWYPRVAVYDRQGWQAHPLYPAGEFYGEFATYDILLDMAEDQVIGATGVPIEGDPGWAAASASPDLRVDYERDTYPVRLAAGCGAQVTSGPGRKCVRFYAENVHHFAMSLNPVYIYEEGRYNDVIVRVLYLPDDRVSWGNGRVVGRTVEALRWLDTLFGPFPWPQITVVHRIEGGGTEFPMMVMNGGPGLGLILHEVGHNYLMGALANNEWREGFLDEGFTSFQTSWYFEEHAPGFDGYAAQERFVLGLDLDGWSQPVSLVSEDYRDFNTYGAMIYTKGELFFHQLRYIVGPEAMRRILREYYRRWKLKHVNELAFLEVAEEASRMDLKWFFAQWLHGTPLYDYRIGKVRRLQLADGTWETTVEVERKGDGRMPVEIGERGRTRTGAVVYARAEGRAAKERVTFLSQTKPGTLVLDPRVTSHDWNFMNTRERRLFDFGKARWRFDTFFREPALRDRPVISLAPTVWYNDASGVVAGIRQRSNYLGRFDRATLWVRRGFEGDVPNPDDIDVHIKLENSRFLYRPRSTQSAEWWLAEGRIGLRVRWERERRSSWWSTDVMRTGWLGQWVVPRITDYLDPLLWEKAGTAEIGRFAEWDAPSGVTHWKFRVNYGGGVTYTRRGRGTRLDERFDVEPFGRATLGLSVRARRGAFTFGARVFGGGYLAASNPPLQRAIPVSGADPYETLQNPFVRSRGALFVRKDVFYHSPGNANLRGYAPGLGGRWIGAANLELEGDLFRRSTGPLRRVAVVLFGDGALTDTLAVRSLERRAWTPITDGGAGLRMWLRLGDIDVPVRVEFPFWVSRPALAHDTRLGTRQFQFRWLASFEPTF